MSKKLSEIYKIGDEVMVCNTDISDEWRKGVVSSFYMGEEEDGVYIDYDNGDTSIWTFPQYIRKVTKLDKALK